MTTNPSRIAAAWLSTRRTITAKAQYLKAIDFTIGLIRRMDKMGRPLPGMATPMLLGRLFDLREAAQKGINLGALRGNITLLNDYGQAILKREAQMEAKYLPSKVDFEAFIQPFPKGVDRAVEIQARHLERVIASALNVPTAAVHDKVLGDRMFYDRAYIAALPEMTSMYHRITSKMTGLGRLEHRIKAAKSCWGKQTRESTPTPFYRFKDLIGTRIVTDTISEMASTAKVVQDKFAILDKKNYYLQGGGYNAINYNLADGWMVFEFQLKTIMNETEAALSHDLIYAPEKSVLRLTQEEADLVGKVIDTSTQLSMADWNANFGVPLRLAHQRDGIKSRM